MKFAATMAVFSDVGETATNECIFSNFCFYTATCVGEVQGCQMWRSIASVGIDPK